MKRSRLTRRTPLKSSGPPQRKTPIARVSKKRRRLMAKVKDDRDDFRSSGDWCEACGEVFGVELMQVHEIAKGIHREKALEHRGCQLRACEKCNLYELNDYSKWPLERQLARVLANRPQDFNLQVFNDVRGRAQTAVTLEDVAQWLRAL